MYRALLVALDGSDCAESAVTYAVGLAERTRAAVHLVHVAGFPAAVPTMRAYLEGVRERIAFRVPGGVAVAVEVGAVIPIVDAYVAAHDVDVVVLATHGRGGVSRAWLGSSAEAMIEGLSVPVLLHRPGPTLPDAMLRPALPTRILVPLERSESSAAILPHAEALAVAVGAELILATVIAPLEVRAAVLGHIEMPMDDALVASRQAAALRFLADVADPLRERGVSVHTVVLMHAHPATAILQGAERAGAEVIAMSTHARRGLRRVVFGSTADKVVRAGSRTMLLNRVADD